MGCFSMDKNLDNVVMGLEAYKEKLLSLSSIPLMKYGDRVYSVDEVLILLKSDDDNSVKHDIVEGLDIINSHSLLDNENEEV